MANSSTDICNLSQLELGEKPSVKSIEIPTNNVEEIYATQYPTTRKSILRQTKPSFALKRDIIAASSVIPIFGYEKAYPLPSDCVKFLGIGEIQDKTKEYAVEGNVVYTNLGDVTTVDDIDSYSLKIRYIADIKEVSEWNPLFDKVCGLQLAIDVCKAITGSLEQRAQLQNDIELAKAEMNAIDSQENPIIRISRSKFLASRRVFNPRMESKR